MWLKWWIIFLKGRIKITGARDNAAARHADERNKGVIFKNCESYIKCIIDINNTQVDDTKDLDVAMPMYNLIEYNDNYSKTCGSLSQYYGDEPNDNLTKSI